MQDVRGRVHAAGAWYPFALAGPAGYDAVEGLGGQAWCDGTVGTIGRSDAGSAQHALATLANYHTGAMRQGGAMALRFLVYAGRMAWDSPPAQGQPRAAGRSSARGAIDQWRGRLPLQPGVAVLRPFPGIERWGLDVLTHGDYDAYWRQHGYNVEEYYAAHADVPTSLLSGGYDAYTRATTDNYRALRQRKRGPVRLIVGPWTHGVTTVHAAHAGDVDCGVEAPLDHYDGVRLRFFDAALQGLDTGLFAEPPVRLCVLGGGSGRQLRSGRRDHGGHWRDEATWPRARARPPTYYLHGAGRLDPAPPTGAARRDDLPLRPPGPGPDHRRQSLRSDRGAATRRLRSAGPAALVWLPRQPAPGGTPRWPRLPDRAPGGGD